MQDPITTAEAAAIIGIDSSMVRRYCRLKRLAAEQVGRDWLIERKDAEAFRPEPVGRRAEKKAKKAK